MTSINLSLAGATGWTGRAIAAGALGADDISLTSAVSRGSAGKDLGTALGGDTIGVPVFADVAEALDGVDVLVEFTSGAVAKAIALTAIEHGVAPVIGSSGLTAADFAEIDAAARAAGVGAISAGNFSLTAAMALAGATLAARHLSHWEIIDYAAAAKPDAPSGTAMELADAHARGRAAAGRPAPRRGEGPPRGAGRHDRRHAGPLRARAQLRRLDGDRVRPGRRAAHHPP